MRKRPLSWWKGREKGLVSSQGGGGGVYPQISEDGGGDKLAEQVDDSGVKNEE